MSDRLAVLPQYLMPKGAMTRLAGRLASAELGGFTTWTIKRFIDKYGVNMVCLFEGEHGPWVLVLVGATIVGSMATVWHGVVNPPRPGRLRTWHYENEHFSYKQGEEMGRFLLGSTVVLLFPKDLPMQFDAHWQPGGAVRLGQSMATLG